MIKLPHSDFRFLISAAMAVGLAACGFHPLYGQMGSHPGAAQGLASIYVEPIPERVGYELRNDLLDLFQSPSQVVGTPYRLRIELKTEEKGLGLQENAAITRYSFHLTAKYQLLEASSLKVVKQGEVHSLMSYNVAQSPYATVAADKDSQNRAAEDIAQRLRTELAVYFLHIAGNGS